MGISREQALDCFASDDLIGIGMEADAVRRRLHPEGVVGYAIQSSVRLGEGGRDAEVARVCAAVRETLAIDGTGVTLTGGIGLGLVGCEELLRGLGGAGVGMQWGDAGEIAAMARQAGGDMAEAVRRLRDAGMESIGGQDDAGEEAEIGEWLEVHRAAHRMGMRTTAGMRFAAGETIERRVARIEEMRRLQDETGGFAALVVSGAGETAVEFLKTLAIARMMLEGIENIVAEGGGAGLKVLQTGMRFGANDAGTVGTGVGVEEDVRRVIRDAGFMPAQRDAAFTTMYLC